MTTKEEAIELVREHIGRCLLNNWKDGCDPESEPEDSYDPDIRDSSFKLFEIDAEDISCPDDDFRQWDVTIRFFNDFGSLSPGIDVDWVNICIESDLDRQTNKDKHMDKDKPSENTPTNQQHLLSQKLTEMMEILERQNRKLGEIERVLSEKSQSDRAT